jgi:predicted transcriptional regulator
MTGKRTKLDIIRDILLTIQSKGGNIKQTHLMYKANLSHTQMKSYLEDLKKKQIIEENKKDHNTFILITEHGFKLLNDIDTAKKFEQTFGL